MSGSFLRWIWSPFHSRDSGSVNWFKFGDWLSVDFIFFVIQVTPLFDLDHYCLDRSSKDLVGLLSFILNVTTGLTSQYHRSVPDYSDCCFDFAVFYRVTSYLLLTLYRGTIPN